MGNFDFGALPLEQWVTLLVGTLSFLGAIGAAVLGGGWVGHHLTHRRGMEDLNLRARVETTKTFLTVSARAHGYTDDRKDSVGAGEQIAAIYLMADMGDRDPWLYWAASKQLEDQIPWLDGNAAHNKHVLKQAEEHLNALPPPGREPSIELEQQRGQAKLQVATMKASAETRERLHAAAKDAYAKISPPDTGWWGRRMCRCLRGK